MTEIAKRCMCSSESENRMILNVFRWKEMVGNGNFGDEILFREEECNTPIFEKGPIWNKMKFGWS